MLNTIVQVNTHPDHTSVTRNSSLQTPDYRHPRQIRIVDTPGDRFATEIVADALKMASTGMRVLVVQLLKGGIRQGHDRVVNLAQNLDWIRCNSLRNFLSADLTTLELDNFQQLWQHVRTTTGLGEYSLVILDELSLAIELGLITVESATSLLAQLPGDVRVILTGTNPHPAIRALASE
jgi:cob(I)alamin adenosyltransferase